MNAIDVNQTRVSVGCRVTLEKKTELLKKAKENGYSSLSQYLENIIMKATLVKENVLEEDSLTTLTDLDIDLIGEKVSEAIKTHSPVSTLISKEDDCRLNEVLRRLSILSGANEEREHNTFIEVLTNKEVTYEDFLNEVVNINLLKEDLKNELLEDLLPIKVSQENKKLILSYFDYLINNKLTKNGQTALIGCLYMGMEHKDGGFFGQEFPGRSEFLDAFKTQNNLNLLDNEDNEQSL